MYTDNLDNYKSYPKTKSCYLDGRYFNKVFHKYPGLIKEPLVINITEKGDEARYSVDMKPTDIDNRFPGLLRVIINTPTTRHSNLLLVDYKGEKLFRFDPMGKDHSPYFNEINKIIEGYMDMYIDFDMFVIDNPPYVTKNPECDKGGFCVAYVVKYAYDYLNQREFDPSEILRFSNMVEQKYGPLPEMGKDVEYGPRGPDPRNLLIGGLGGAAVGGLLAGGPGLLVGGLGGMAVGSLL
jgi:hypothetical protein